MFFIPVTAVSLIDTVIVSVTSLTMVASITSFRTVVVVRFHTLVTISSITVMVSGSADTITVIAIGLLLMAVVGSSGVVTIGYWGNMVHWCRILVSVSGFGRHKIGV